MDKLKSMAKSATPPKGTSRPGRPMKYPYTLSAKIAQFPWRFYTTHNWIYRYYCVALVLSLPVFMYIQRLAKSPGNKAKWRAIQKKEHDEIKHRFD